MAQRALNPEEFTSMVNAITTAFGDPTRRDIYLLVREESDGLTASEVASLTGLHSNVARHHLEKLTGESYLTISHRQSNGAGRPAKVYRASASELALDLDTRHGDIILTLLGKALSRLDPADAAELAQEVGQEFGKQMAASLADTTEAQRSFRSALHLAAEALSSHGFAAHATKEGEELRIVANSCPFGDVAIEHPVICAVDQGMVRGLLGSLYGSTDVALAASVAQGDKTCATDVIANEPRQVETPVTLGTT